MGPHLRLGLSLDLGLDLLPTLARCAEHPTHPPNIHPTPPIMCATVLPRQVGRLRV